MNNSPHDPTDDDWLSALGAVTVITLGSAEDTLIVLGGVPDVAGFRMEFPLAEYRRGGTSIPPCWTIPFPDAAQAVMWADRVGAEVDPAVRGYAKGLWRAQVRATCLASATRLVGPLAPPTPVEVPGLVTSLLPSQLVVVTAAEGAWVSTPAGPGSTHRALIVADEPGLGKTLMGLCALRSGWAPAQRAVIVCPSRLTLNWVNEMRSHFQAETFSPWVANTKTATPIPPESDVVVIGWDVLTSWVGTLIQWRPDAVISDEGHYAKAGALRTKKNTQAKREGGRLVRDDTGNAILETVTVAVGGSARSTAVLDLGRAVARNRGLVVALTGTPIVNRPLELFPLLDFVGVAQAFGGELRYKERYCGPKTKQIGGGETRRDYSGSSNLRELHARLVASGHYIRRTKAHLVAAGVMKPKTVDGVDAYDRSAPRRPWRIVATPEQMKVYRDVEGEERTFFTQRAQEIAQEWGTSFEAPEVRQRLVGEGPKHLVRIGNLRRAAAQVKIPHVAAHVEALVAQGEKVVVVAHHRDVVDDYAARFGGLKIQGGMSTKAVEAAKLRFNSDPDAMVLVLAVEAGKTGHTLCKQGLLGGGRPCAQILFAEQVWTPGDETQAQDRVWRIGQPRPVTVTNAVLAGSVDEFMYDLRAAKRQVVDALVDGSQGDEESEGAGRVITDLVYGAPEARSALH